MTKEQALKWFKDNCSSYDTNGDLVADYINKDTFKRFLSAAIPSPGDNQSLEEAAESEGVKYSLRGVYPTRYSALLNKHSEAAREKYTPFVDGFLAGAAYGKGGEEKHG